MVTITKDQKIQFKLKGMKSGAVSIDIREIYCQLTDCDAPEDTNNSKRTVSIRHDQPTPGSKKNPMISLIDLRSKNAISGLDYQTLSKFDGIIKGLIDEMDSSSKIKKR